MHGFPTNYFLLSILHEVCETCLPISKKKNNKTNLKPREGVQNFELNTMLIFEGISYFYFFSKSFLKHVNH